MSIGDLLLNGGMIVFFGSMAFVLFVQFFLGDTVDMEKFWSVWYFSCFAMGLGVVLKYSGRLRLKYSKKKCIKCGKASAMGSIYCEFHRRQASREVAFQQGHVPLGDDDDDNLGY